MGCSDASYNIPVRVGLEAWWRPRKYPHSGVLRRHTGDRMASPEGLSKDRANWNDLRKVSPE